MKDQDKSKLELIDELKEYKQNFDSLTIKLDTNISSLKESKQKLVEATNQLAFQFEERLQRAAELIDANIELAYQNQEKANRAAELIDANIELAFQNQEKEKRVEELLVANRAIDMLIGESKITAFELFQRSQESHAMMDNNPDIIGRFDEKFRYLYINRPIDTGIGSLPSQIIGKTIDERGFSKELTKKYKNAHRYVFAAGKEKIIEVSLPINGALHYFESRWAPEFSSDGKVATALCISRDITIRKQAENKLIYHNQELIIQNKEKENRAKELVKANRKLLVAEKKVRNFLSTLEQKVETRTAQLVIAKQRAEQSDRLKTAFLANMSHEIRTPMNGILGFAELLKEPNLSGVEQQEFIEIIEKSGLRMLNIINNIIDISKIESGLIKINRADFNLNEIIDYLLAFFKPELESKNLKILFSKPSNFEELRISTDKEKLLAVLSNLIKNAIKYTDSGTIALGYQHKPGFLEFFVKDSGIGISKNRQKAIFERFIQADIEDIHAYQGAGLGLAISKSYVELMKGEIWVDSEPGKGSIFYFTMPYTSIVDAAVVKKNKISNVRSQERKLKILIVEDDEISELYLARIVSKIGSRILVAINGFEAVRICRENLDLDLILMDIGLPDLDGYEVIKQIRHFNKEVVIITQTGYSFKTDREKAMNNGCNAYISKPIDKAELLTLINTHCFKS